MARTYRLNTPRMRKPWMRYSGQYKAQNTVRLHTVPFKYYYWFGAFEEKNSYLRVRFGFGWTKNCGMHKYSPAYLPDDQDYLFCLAHSEINRAVFYNDYWGKTSKLLRNRAMKLLRLAEFVSSVDFSRATHSPYRREGGFARKKFIRRRRMIERNWLKSRDWDNENLYERRKTSGWDTW